MEAGRLPAWKLAYRIDEACATIGIGKTKRFELIKTGKIRAKKDAGVTLILREDLRQYLEALPDR